MTSVYSDISTLDEKISHTAKLQKLTITYWTMDESEEEGIDNTITVIEMLVDYLTGDLVFVADGNDIVQC